MRHSGKLAIAFALVLATALGLAAGYNLDNLFETRTVPASRSYKPPPPPDPAPTRKAPAVAPEHRAAFADLLRQSSIFDRLYLAYQLAAAADFPTLEDYTVEALGYADPLLNRHVANIFVERMIALDLSKALDFVERLPAGDNRRQLLARLLASWARQDPEAALAYAESIDDPALQRMVAAAFAVDATLPAEIRSALAGPAAMSDTIVFGSGTAAGRPLYRMGVQGSVDPALIEQTLADLEQAPRRTVESLLSEPASNQRQVLLNAALAELSRLDLDLALALIQEYPDVRMAAESIVIDVAARERPLESQALVEEYAQRTGNSGPLSAMVSTWMRTDPASAKAYFDTVPERFRRDVLASVGAEYASRNPREGIQWYLEQDVDAGILTMMLNGPDADDTAALVESMIDSVDLPGANRRLLTSLVDYKSRMDPTEGVQWIQRYRNQPAYEEAYARAVTRLAEQDPAAAAAQLQHSPASTAGRNSAYAGVARNYVMRRPEAALAWANGLADTSARSSALASMAFTVSRFGDTTRAREIYYAMPEGDTRYRVGSRIAMMEAGRDPERLRAEMQALDIPAEFIDSYITVMGR